MFFCQPKELPLDLWPPPDSRLPSEGEQAAPSPLIFPALLPSAGLWVSLGPPQVQVTTGSCGEQLLFLRRRNLCRTKEMKEEDTKGWEHSSGRKERMTLTDRKRKRKERRFTPDLFLFNWPPMEFFLLNANILGKKKRFGKAVCPFKVS